MMERKCGSHGGGFTFNNRMTMSYTIKQATKAGIKLLMALYSESGGGKTYSGLLIGRGLVGPSGKLCLIDTESGRGQLYADDKTIGGYDVLELGQPFSPENYIGAIEYAESQGYGAIIIDSMSHEWEGIGGVTDMAAENEQRTGKPGLHNWNKPKMEHQRLIGRILRSKAHIICCIRAKYKTRQKRDERGKQIIVRDEQVSPIQSEDFIFEMIVHAALDQNHNAVITKAHGELIPLLPKSGEEMFTVQHGANLAQWCLGKAVQPKPETKPVANEKTKKRFLELLTEKFGEAVVFNYGLAREILKEGQTVQDWPIANVAMTKQELENITADIEQWSNE